MKTALINRAQLMQKMLPASHALTGKEVTVMLAVGVPQKMTLLSAAKLPGTEREEVMQYVAATPVSGEVFVEFSEVPEGIIWLDDKPIKQERVRLEELAERTEQVNAAIQQEAERGERVAAERKQACRATKHLNSLVSGFAKDADITQVRLSELDRARLIFAALDVVAYHSDQLLKLINAPANAGLKLALQSGQGFAELCSKLSPKERSLGVAIEVLEAQAPRCKKFEYAPSAVQHWAARGLALTIRPKRSVVLHDVWVMNIARAPKAKAE
jgi:hypothetical protein